MAVDAAGDEQMTRTPQSPRLAYDHDVAATPAATPIAPTPPTNADRRRPPQHPNNAGVLGHSPDGCSGRQTIHAGSPVNTSAKGGCALERRNTSDDDIRIAPACATVPPPTSPPTWHGQRIGHQPSSGISASARSRPTPRLHLTRWPTELGQRTSEAINTTPNQCAHLRGAGDVTGRSTKWTSTLPIPVITARS